jgi:hypothetical protein
MRSMILSLMLGLGVLGFSLAAPTQAKAEDPASTGNGDTQLVRWYGHRGWGGWGGYGYNRGYPYGGWYGGYSNYYYPRYYGGYSPWGYGVRPYANYYYRPGFYW